MGGLVICLKLSRYNADSYWQFAFLLIVIVNQLEKKNTEGINSLPMMT